MIAVFMEDTQGIIRGGEDCDSKGKPYTFVVSYARMSDTSVYLYGLCVENGKFTADMYRAIGASLRGKGFKTVTWERRNNGHRHVEVNT